DVVRLDAEAGVLHALVDDAEWDARKPAPTPEMADGTGRELFRMMNQRADEAEKGASAMLAAAGL
ncbi:MAG TPA: phosphogluconate dehydratase, partial [Sphingomonas bacterium]|nr:phosphogluconate dehydratase [Sphingomonas bacterium]